MTKQETKNEPTTNELILGAIVKSLIPDFDIAAEMKHVYVDLDGNYRYMPPADVTSKDSGESQENSATDGHGSTEDAAASEPTKEKNETPDTSDSSDKVTSVKSHTRRLRSAVKDTVKEADPEKMNDEQLVDWYDKQLQPSGAMER